jgi:tetratricopeptide (TPR) repeat protein
MAGRFAEAIKFGDHVLKDEVIDGGTRARLALARIYGLLALGGLSAAELKRLVSDFEHSYVDVVDAELAYEAARIRTYGCLVRGDIEGARQLVDQLAQLAANLPAAKEATAYGFVGRVHSWTTSRDDALGWARRAREHLSAALPEDAANASLNIADVLYEAGELKEALLQYDYTLERIRAAGALNIFARCAVNKASVLVEMGRFAEAREIVKPILSTFTEEDPFQTLATAYGNLAIASFYNGDHEDLLSLAEKSLANSANVLHHVLISWALMGLAHLELGSLTRAHECANELDQLFPDSTAERYADISFVEIFRARLTSRFGNREMAIQRLETAIIAYQNRDPCSRLRLQIELAKTLRSVDRLRAREIAERTRIEAASLGARPIEEDAAGILARYR